MGRQLRPVQRPKHKTSSTVTPQNFSTRPSYTSKFTSNSLFHSFVCVHSISSCPLLFLHHQPAVFYSFIPHSIGSYSNHRSEFIHLSLSFHAIVSFPHREGEDQHPLAQHSFSFTHALIPPQSPALTSPTPSIFT